MSRLLPTATALLVAATSSGQPPTFRAATRLIEVSVVVDDGSGRPVTGLSREDFTLFDNGQPQPIEVFAPPPGLRLAGPGGPASTAEATPPAAAAAVPAPRPVEFTNRLGQDVRGVTVILIDRLNTSFEDQHNIRADVMKRLREIRADDRVAVYVLESDVVRVLHDLTADPSSLLLALSRYQARTSRQAQATDAAPTALTQGGNAAEDAEFAAWLRETTKAVSNEHLRNRIALTASAFKAIAGRLASVRGRKNLVWLSSAFPTIFDSKFGPQSMADTLSEATRALNNANIALYAIDARGLVTPTASAAATMTREVNRNAERSAEADAQLVGLAGTQVQAANVETMQSMADATGGQAFHGTNDAGKAIARALEDSRLTYVLGYYPAPAAWDGAFHAIKVTVNRRGVRARSRMGYFASPPSVPGPQPAEALLDVFRSPLESTEIGLTAQADTRALTAKRGGELAVNLRVEPGSITVSRKDAGWEGAVDLFIGQSTPEGRYFKTFAARMALEFTDQEHEQLLRDGLRVTRTIAVRPDAHRVHLVVRDAPTGLTGSLFISLR